MGNFCQQILKPLGSYTRVFTVMRTLRDSYCNWCQLVLNLLFAKEDKGFIETYFSYSEKKKKSSRNTYVDVQAHVPFPLRSL